MFARGAKFILSSKNMAHLGRVISIVYVCWAFVSCVSKTEKTVRLTGDGTYQIAETKKYELFGEELPGPVNSHPLGSSEGNDNWGASTQAVSSWDSWKKEQENIEGRNSYQYRQYR